MNFPLFPYIGISHHPRFKSLHRFLSHFRSNTFNFGLTRYFSWVSSCIQMYKKTKSLVSDLSYSTWWNLLFHLNSFFFFISFTPLGSCVFFFVQNFQKINVQISGLLFLQIQHCIPLWIKCTFIGLQTDKYTLKTKKVT